MGGRGNDNIGKSDFVMFGQMNKDEYVKVVASRSSLGGNSIPSEIIELCKLLQISKTSKHHIIVDKYNEVINKWEPSRFVNDPDKYFHAQQVADQLKAAYIDAAELLHEKEEKISVWDVTSDRNSGLLLNSGTDTSGSKAADRCSGSQTQETGLQPVLKDLHKLPKDQLWKKAYDIQYKRRSNDLSVAIDIYKYLIFNYPDSDEAGYAKSQLEILKVDLGTNAGYIKDNGKKRFDSHNNILSNDDGWNLCPGGAGNMPDLPSGLYTATAILGFPLGTGYALGSYGRIKRLLDNGDAYTADQHIQSSTLICWLILIPNLVIMIYICYMYNAS